MILLTTLMFIGAAADNQGWYTVQRDVMINFDLENIPLEIKTNSVIGSGEEVYVEFYTSRGGSAGRVRISFTSPPQYNIWPCTSGTNFPTNLPTATDKVWRITKNRTSQGIRVQIHCNEVEVLNFLLSNTRCINNYSSWRDTWSSKVAKIDFSSDSDTASDYYRAVTGNCIGLKAEWESTMETTTQFPVATGTVVEVTCSESGALNKGSSAVTCVVGTGFSYNVEPICSKPGWYTVQRDVRINFHLENIPLEIMTDSAIGSGYVVSVQFYNTQEDWAGGVEISFTSPPQYEIWPCTDWTNFTTNLPTATDKVWRITLDRTSGIRVQINCNEVEVLNLLLSDSTCISDSGWSESSYYWSRKVAKIQFSPYDSASDYYRAMTGSCTGLKAEWKSTMETKTRFPVDTGTVVEVTCSESGALRIGSSAMTCVVGTGFTYTAEPSCPKEGWYEVQRDVMINFDLENIPLEIKTNSEEGSGDQVRVYFYPSQGDSYESSDVYVKFTSPPQYRLGWCTSWTNFPKNLPTATDKVWRITNTRTSGIKLLIHCNEVEVVNILLSNSTCSDSSWSWYWYYWTTRWSVKVANINFHPGDTASKYYRVMRGSCTGLKAEWKSTMETTTQFPVDTGTVVEVTCSESGGLNNGSSAITCVVGTGFFYTAEPSCPKKGWYKVQRGVMINFDLEKNPLEIKTNSRIGTGDALKVWFFTSQGDYAGAVGISFTSSPQFQIGDCTKLTNFATNLPTATDKVWRIKLDRTSGIRVQINCTEVEVLNFLLSDSTCIISDSGWSEWSYYWSRKVAKIQFSPYDTASDYYRAMTGSDVIYGETLMKDNSNELSESSGGGNTVAIVVPVVIVVLLAGLAAGCFLVYKRKQNSVNETVHMSKVKNVDSDPTLKRQQDEEGSNIYSNKVVNVEMSPEAGVDVQAADQG